MMTPHDVQPNPPEPRALRSEFNATAAVFNSRAHQLASLLAAGGEQAPWWRTEDLAAIFRHQLAAPLGAEWGGTELASFGELFQQAAPSLALLRQVKDFAKANMNPAAGGLPAEIARALYYLSLAAALVRLNQRITQLPDADLQAGLRHTLRQPWLAAPAPELLTLALDRLADGRKGGQP